MEVWFVPLGCVCHKRKLGNTEDLSSYVLDIPLPHVFCDIREDPQRKAGAKREGSSEQLVIHFQKGADDVHFFGQDINVGGSIICSRKFIRSASTFSH